MTERYDVFILDSKVNETVGATLIVDIEKELVTDAQAKWSEFSKKAGVKPQHSHWDWTKKFQLTIDYSLTYRMFGIECKGEIQGLILVRVGKECKIESQKGKPLIYVDYLASAPWNSKASTTDSTFKLVGKVLLQAAIELSEDEEFKGRIGLHSLPQAETWYTNCGMTDLGKDGEYLNLCYFEMTPEQAAAFKKG
jgi:hypothetical protein